MKFIKTEVDIGRLAKTLDEIGGPVPTVNPGFRDVILRTTVRLVMSSETRKAVLSSSEGLMLRGSPIFTAKPGHKETLLGHNVDLNESLEFGEVLFTQEIVV